MPTFQSNKIRIYDQEADHDIIDIEYKKDNIIFNHAQNVSPILETAELCRNYSDNGWTADRTMRQIATIPAGEFVNHPEWAYDEKALLKWLKSEEGRKYRTVNKGI